MSTVIQFQTVSTITISIIAIDSKHTEHRALKSHIISILSIDS